MGVPAILPSRTPVHTECCATRLQSIKPLTVLPEQYTERSQALTALKRIEFMEISDSFKRNGHRYYVIDIYYKLTHSHIPTLNKSVGVAPSMKPVNRRPDARVERRLSEIGNLRDEMYYFAHNGHGAMPCEFCRGIVDYVLHGSAKPRTLLRWLDGQAEIQATLTQFLNHILRLTTTVKAFGGHQCQGQDNIPSLVKDFLFPSVEDQIALSL